MKEQAMTRYPAQLEEPLQQPSTIPNYLRRLPHLKQRTGLSRSSIYALIKLEQFPKPISIGKRAVAWLDSDIEKWICDRISASRGGVK